MISCARSRTASFGLRARTDGRVTQTVDARELFGKIAQAAWSKCRPRRSVRRHDQRLAHQPRDRPDHRVQSLLGIHEPGQQLLQPGELNLLKFLRDDDTFDAEKFEQAVELIITAMDISICFADFPTEAIGSTTRAYRQLGIGYANLGACSRPRRARLRLRRRPGIRGSDHLADDRCLLSPLG